MSYAAINHLQYRLTADGYSTKLKLVHRAVGEVSSEHREGVVEGWNYWLNRIKQHAESQAKK
jgi:hypothetical protein